MTAAKSAATYVRLSSHRGDADPSTSPARQEATCRAYAEAKGWTVVEVVSDLDVSGSDKGLRLDRPGLIRLRELFDTVDVVIFAKLDRLARNVVDFRRFAEEADESDVALVSVAESLDLTTSSGRFVATLLSAFAELEAATIHERTRAGRDGVVDQGRWPGGSAPYGYRTAAKTDGPGRVLELDPVEAREVRRAADAVLGGASFYAVVLDLNDRGVKPRRAQAWAVKSLQVVLTGDAALGRQRHRGELVVDDDGIPVTVWPPILTVEESSRIRERVSTKRTKVPRRPRQARLLSGVLTCATCGSTLRVGNAGSGRNGQAKRYVCRGEVDGRGCKTPLSIHAEQLEAFVEAELLDIHGDTELLERVETAPALVADIVDVEDALRRTAEAMTEPGADVAALSARVAKLAAKRDELATVSSTPTVELVRTGRTVREAWESAELDARRAMLRSALAWAPKVRPNSGPRRFDPSRVELVWTVTSELGGLELVDELAS